MIYRFYINKNKYIDGDRDSLYYRKNRLQGIRFIGSGNYSLFHPVTRAIEYFE